MADRWAVANGNWSNTATWNGGTLPTAADDVFADGFSVTINQNVTVLSVRTTQRSGGTAGGGFTLNAGFALTADVIAGTTTCVTFNATSPNSATITGNCTGGSIVQRYGALNDSTGTLTITGDCTGGTGTLATGAWNQSTGTLTIIGNCAGGPGPSATGVRNEAAGVLTIIGNCTGGSNSDSHGANNNSNGTMTITGNCTGGTGNGAYGTNNGSNGTITITGNCTGGSNSTGYGARNVSTGTITIIGSAIGGTVAPGAFNNSTGLLTVKRAVGNGWGIGSVGLNSIPGVQSNLSGSQTRVEEFEFGALGQSPILGAVSVPDLSTNVCLVHRLSASKKTLIDPSANTGQANQSDVRAGASYALGNRIGTLAVPATNQVAVGVAVDNTVGTAVLTAQNIRDAIGLPSGNLDARLPSGLINGRMNSFVDVVSSGAVQDIFETYPLVETYAPSGTFATPAQMLYFMQQTFSQFGISGVYISVKKLDGATEAARFILDDQQTPTSRTRIS